MSVRVLLQTELSKIKLLTYYHGYHHRQWFHHACKNQDVVVDDLYLTFVMKVSRERIIPTMVDFCYCSYFHVFFIFVMSTSSDSC